MQLYENCNVREDDGSCIDLRPWKTKGKSKKQKRAPSGCKNRHEKCKQFAKSGKFEKRNFAVLAFINVYVDLIFFSL